MKRGFFIASAAVFAFGVCSNAAAQSLPWASANSCQAPANTCVAKAITDARSAEASAIQGCVNVANECTWERFEASTSAKPKRETIDVNPIVSYTYKRYFVVTPEVIARRALTTAGCTVNTTKPVCLNCIPRALKLVKQINSTADQNLLGGAATRAQSYVEVLGGQMCAGLYDPNAVTGGPCSGGR
jgi:hypothetical protein